MMENTYIKESANKYNLDLKQSKLDKEHEQTIKKEDHNHAYRCLQADQEQALKILDKNLGVLGRLFGSPENASKNITALICFALLLGAAVISCLVYWCKDDLTFVKDIWRSVIPVITLALGYLFGKN